MPKYAEYVFRDLKPGFAAECLSNKADGVASAIVAGQSYGQGSSREHAALCPMYLGVKLLLARSVERIHAANLVNFGILRLIVADPQAGKAALEAAGYIVKLNEVVAVEVPDDAGGLTRILAKADEARLDIEYMYAFSSAAGQRAIVIMRFSDPDRAVAELQQRGINVVAPVELLDTKQ